MHLGGEIRVNLRALPHQYSHRDPELFVGKSAYVPRTLPTGTDYIKYDRLYRGLDLFQCHIRSECEYLEFKQQGSRAEGQQKLPVLTPSV